MKLANAFRPCQYENDLWGEIRDRKQGTTERIVIYTSVGLLRRLPTSMSMEEKLKWIKKYLQPCNQRLLVGRPMTTIAELEGLCRKVEPIRFRSGELRDKTNQPGRLCKPDLDYTSPRVKPRAAAVQVCKELTRSWKNPSAEAVTRRIAERRCYSGNEIEHFATPLWCLQPFQKHCFTCADLV